MNCKSESLGFWFARIWLVFPDEIEREKQRHELHNKAVSSWIILNLHFSLMIWSVVSGVSCYDDIVCNQKRRVRQWGSVLGLQSSAMMLNRQEEKSIIKTIRGVWRHERMITVEMIERWGHSREGRQQRSSVCSGGSNSDLICPQSKPALLGQGSDVSPEASVLEVSWQSK